MGFRRVLKILVIVSVTVSISFSAADSLFSDNPELSDGGLLAFNSPDSSLDFSSWLPDASDSLFDESNNSDLFSSDDINLGDSFQLASCSALEELPAIGKIRTRESGVFCPQPGAQPPMT